MNRVVCIGNGKLAKAVIGELGAIVHLPVEAYTPGEYADADTVFVHIGSGREYAASLQQALDCKAAYIQASTVKSTPFPPPPDNSLRYIHAPNLDITIIKLFYWLKMAQGLFDGEAIQILESHQKEKKSQPGTALKFCEFLQVPAEQLVSIRDPEKQRHLGIANLTQHAFHRMVIGEEDSHITIETKVEGAQGYIRGLARIIAALPQLAVKNYEVEELVALHLL